MCKLITSLFVLFFFSNLAVAQTTLFSDNFEAGTVKWVLQALGDKQH